MDLLGVIFITVFLITIGYPNVIFFKELKLTPKNYFKYKLIYFLISVFIPCSIFIFCGLITLKTPINDFFRMEIDQKNYFFRIVFACIFFPPSILINIYISKIYIKRISKTKNKNEIELIGKE